MNLDPEQHMVIFRTRGELRQQVLDGLEKIRLANGGVEPDTFGEGNDIDHAAFASVVEALVALGAPVDDDLIQMAGLKPVDQII